MKNVKDEELIDLRKIAVKVWQRKKLFYKVIAISFIVSCIYIFPKPRTYECSVMLAPELENPGSGGTLASLASSFGVNIGSALSSDAISPTLYPDLMASTDFVVSLFPVKVTTKDNELTTDYYTYMWKHQDVSIWYMPIKWCLGGLEKLTAIFREKEDFNGVGNEVNPFRMSKLQTNIAAKMMYKITCSVDKKNDVITITVEDQDPLICATMADTVSAHLQEFITNYRTNKSRVDFVYYEKLVKQAKEEYNNALNEYARFADANLNVTKESVLTKRTELENNVQLTFSTYQNMSTQLQLSRAKVQENTPAFTTLQRSTVPIKASKPKRIFFVIGMVFFACVITTFYILKDDFINQLKKQ